MEFFKYQDWIADGRRSAKLKGKPDLDTEMLVLEKSGHDLCIVYRVDLKTTKFEVVVETFKFKDFASKFMSMMEVES